MERLTSAGPEDTGPDEGTFWRSLEVGSCLSRVWARVTPVLGVRGALGRPCCHCECGLHRCDAELVPDHNYGRGHVSDSRARSHRCRAPSPHHHHVAPCLWARNPSPHQHQPPTATAHPWPGPAGNVTGTKSSRWQPPPLPPGQQKTPPARASSAGRRWSAGQGLTGQALAERGGFLVTLAGRQQRTVRPSPPEPASERGAGGRSAPQPGWR